MIIDKLSNSRATDIYGISNSFVKLHKAHLIGNLTRLINNVISKGTFPDSLKIGIISPIHKKGSKTNTSNYRPISVLPIFSKIIEYVILRRLQEHFNKNKVLSPNQFGYTEFSNTELAALNVLNKVYKSIDINHPTSLTCLDLSKAFDCVQHSLLINKLRKTRLSPTFLNLMHSYFQNRLQVTKIDNVISSPLSVKNGVAQGGILSGLLFNFYINSLNMNTFYSSITVYCDDISLVTTADNTTLLKQKLESDLSTISRWLKYHCLFANESKTKKICFHNKRRQEDFYEVPLNIKFNNIILERVENVKLLGLVIDESLTFKEHIHEIQSKLVSFIFALKRIRYFISDKTSLMLYYAYIQSRLSYMNVIWAAAPNYLIDSLEITQRKALRVVFCKPWNCSKSELYSCRTLPVTTLCKFSSLILVFKIIKKTAKIIFEPSFIRDIHPYLTRNSDDFYIEHARTHLCSGNFFIRAFSEFNTLPATIKNQVTISRFKIKLKEFLFNTVIVGISSSNSNS